MIEIKNLLTGELLTVKLSEFLNQYNKIMVGISEATAANPAGTPKFVIAEKGTPKSSSQTTAAKTTVQTTNTIQKPAKKGCGCK